MTQRGGGATFGAAAWLVVACLCALACARDAVPARTTAVDVGPGGAEQHVERAEADLPRDLPPLPPLTAAEDAALDDLVARLRHAKPDERPDLLEALQRDHGGRGLVRALRGAVPDAPPEQAWFRAEQILAAIERLADPGGADALTSFIGATDDVHARGRAAVLLAQLGDLRAAEPLARRLRSAPLEVYALERFWETGPSGHLARTDQPRVVAARALVDLARLYPERRDHLARAAASAVEAWAEDGPTPHANALRFLGSVGAAREKLLAWATPPAPLPDPDAQPPFPLAFEIAQSALRALGRSGDAAALDPLEKQLLRREAEGLDIRMEALMTQRHVMRGMALRALGFGAAQGLSELGDARAAATLDRVIADPQQHEEVRIEACEARVWCASDAELTKLFADLSLQRTPTPSRTASATDAEDVDRVECLVAALARRGPPEPVVRWVHALRDGTRPGMGRSAAAVLAVGGVGSAEPTLLGWLRDDDARPISAAVLALGGTEVGARSAAKAVSDDARAAAQLGEILRAIGMATEGHLQRRTLLRWGRRFRAVGEPAWMRGPLGHFFESSELDSGPHSLARVTLRRRLVEIAVFGAPDDREDARTVLDLMGERGALDYLARLGRARAP